MAKILIIEDDAIFGELLLMFLEDHGHEAQVAQTLRSARHLLDENTPDVILLDQQLPDGLGIDFLRTLQQDELSPPVIMLSGVSDNAVAIQAMGLGAHDFVRKPLDEVELEATLNNALKTHRLSRQVMALTQDEDYQVDVSQIVGASPGILDICKTIGRVARSNATVLITGESGTGKEVVAHAIHHHSQRDGLFLPVNCSALAENLLESELFGHEKGSFTGAVAHKEGKFEQTEGGTLFLDELGEMPSTLQAKLLRVLQEGAFERVGGTRTLHSDSRIIAATNRDLQSMMADGRFREDLFYRLNVVHIHIPPLRERKQDLPLLIEHLLRKINTRQHTSIRHITEAAWKQLQQYDWPGNIRELENTLTRAAVLAGGDSIGDDLLSLPGPATATATAQEAGSTLRLLSLQQLEQAHIAAILQHVRWHKGKACKILGISRPALDRKISKYQLEAV